MNAKIRFATFADARGILEAQYSAIHEIARNDYPAEILNEWAKPVNLGRIERFANALPTQTILVAEVDDEIVGFGEIVESTNELRAVYVSAKYARLGTQAHVSVYGAKQALG